MKLYSVWQPLDDEDQRTALVFGYLRHAPVESGLSPWLSEVLGRPVRARPLEPQDFWPGYRSHMPDCSWTYPELVFDADDDEGPLHIVIEAKVWPGTHYVDQLVREVVDTAHEEPASRIALIAVGADLGTPAGLPEWQEAVDAGLARHGPHGACATVRYSSWAQLGDAIEAVTEAVPAMAVYAKDVLAQMRFHGMLGYKGAPVYEDLEGGLTTVNAFDVVNRVVVSARQFFRTLHDAQAFRATGLTSYWSRFEMRRNGTSTSLNQDEEWFQVSMFMSAYKKPAWPKGAGAFAAFYFLGEGDDPLLVSGAFLTRWDDPIFEYDNSDVVEQLTDTRLAAFAGTELPITSAGPNSEWLHDERPWLPGEPDTDITWTLEHLTAAATLFD